MTEIQERRADNAGRVRVETLVEVCGNEPGIPAFEAEAVDVSARGMHLRTAYLPDNGAPLVCRFEDGGPILLAVRIDDEPGKGQTPRDPALIRSRFMKGLGTGRSAALES